MNPNDAVVAKFAALFDGRRDIWGAVHGECKREPLTDQLFRQHLYGHGSVGVYPLCEDDQGNGWVKWGATDVDNGFDMLVLARNIRAVLTKLGITAWVEKSKGKGFHVIAFATEWIPAEDMRRAFLVAHKVAGVPPTEVNPKATRLDHRKCPPTSGCKLDPREPDLASGPAGRRGVLDHLSGVQQARASSAAPGDDGRGRGPTGLRDRPGGEVLQAYAPAVSGGASQGPVGVEPPGVDGLVRAHDGGVPLAGRAPTAAGQGVPGSVAERGQVPTAQPPGCLAASNYLNLPLARQWSDQGTRVILDVDRRTLDGIPPVIPLGVWVEQAWDTRTSPEVFKAAAALWREPPKVHVDVPDWDPDNSTVPEPVRKQLSGLAWTIFRDGPLDGRDRSGTLMRLAYLCRESDLSAADTFKVVWDCDGRHGQKFHNRADGIEQVQQMVVRAFSKAMEGHA